MKTIFLVLSTILFTAASNAQTIAKADQPVDKEVKAKTKQKQNEDIDKALKEAGIADEVAAKFKQLQKEYGT